MVLISNWHFTELKFLPDPHGNLKFWEDRMSSISSSDRNRLEEKIRQTREEYENRESENLKRRNAEKKRLEEQHNDEVKNISDIYEGRIAKLKERNKEALTDRDFENNRKIDEVRQTYRESMRNKSEEANSSRAEQKNAYDNNLRKLKEISEVQKENLLRQMNDEVEQRDSRFEKVIGENRNKAQEAVQQKTRAINDSHAREKEAIIGGYRDSLRAAKRNKNEMQKSYESRLKDSQRLNESNVSRWSQKYQDAIVNKDKEYGDALEIKKEIMKEELQSIRDKFENKLADKVSVMDEQGQDLRDTVNERVTSQVRSRDSQIQRLNSKLNNEMAKNEKLRGIERKNIVNAYEDRINLVEQQREDTFTSMKELNEDRVEKMLNENHKLLRNTDRNYKTKLSIANTQHREDRETFFQQHKDQVTQISNNAENRVKKILNLSNKNQEDLEKYFADSMDTAKESFMDRMDSFRDKTAADKSAFSKAMTERFRAMETGFNNKLEQTVEKYENKISQLQENQSREIKRLENMYTERLENRDKATKMEKESLSMKYEAKIAQLNESHEDQLDRMDRRHKEDMQNLSARMSSYSRKA